MRHGESLSHGVDLEEATLGKIQSAVQMLWSISPTEQKLSTHRRGEYMLGPDHWKPPTSTGEAGLLSNPIPDIQAKFYLKVEYN